MLLFIIKLLNKWIKHRRLLRQFYVEIYTWVIDGCPMHPAFSTSMALCSNLNMWLWTQPGMDANLMSKTTRLMVNQFKARGLNPGYPFDEAQWCYNRDMLGRRFYDNVSRRQWLHDHALQSLW